MYEAGAPSVLRCGQCNKPFDKESSLKRHGYYCRSRRAGSASTRSRSCTSCASGKARCDGRRPECSRCLSKAVKCHYPANTRRSTGPVNQYSDDAPIQQREAVPSLNADHARVENRHAAGNDGDMLLDAALDITDPNFTDLGGGYFGPVVDFADFLNPQTNDKDVQYHPLESSSLARNAIPFTGQPNHVQQAIWSPDISLQAPPTHALRSFNQRPKLKTGAQRTANLILHTLKSYPLMILRDDALPPFIHPHFVSSDVENDDMEPLTNCINLVRMLSGRVPGSRKLFWKNVRMECERLCADHLQLNKWELLAAMQALSIYILTRLGEGQTDHNNFDSLLVTTVIVIAAQFNSIDTDTTCSAQSALYNRRPKTSWENWILEESARRLCVVYQVVNMLVYFEPAAMCNLHQTDLLLAPLPARKQLWEARDELAWKAESEAQPARLQTAFGLAANGDLVRVEQGRPYCGDAVLRSKSADQRTPAGSSADWEEWCAGMDGFGGLVMLAASLVA